MQQTTAMSTNTTRDMSASFISPTDQSDHTLELTMQQTPYTSANVAVENSYHSRMNFARTRAYLKDIEADMKRKEEWWTSKTSSYRSQSGSDDNRPSPSSTKDKMDHDLADAATNYYELLGDLTSYAMSPFGRFSFVREVRKAKRRLRLTEGYADLPAAIRGGMEHDEKNLFFGVYADLSNQETGALAITRNPATEQGFEDYFELEGPCSLPPVCASGIPSDTLADRHSYLENSTASTACSLC